MVQRTASGYFRYVWTGLRQLSAIAFPFHLLDYDPHQARISRAILPRISKDSLHLRDLSQVCHCGWNRFGSLREGYYEMRGKTKKLSYHDVNAFPDTLAPYVTFKHRRSPVR